MSVKRASDVACEPIGVGQGTIRQVLIGPGDGPNFVLRRFIMEPGGRMPPHKNTVEHEQYVLRGRARIGIGEDLLEVSADDVVFVPAGTPHWYQTLGDVPFEFLCIVPNSPDQIEILGEVDS